MSIRWKFKSQPPWFINAHSSRVLSVAVLNMISKNQDKNIKGGLSILYLWFNTERSQGRNWNCDLYCYIDFLLCSCSNSFLIQPRNNCPDVPIKERSKGEKQRNLCTLERGTNKGVNDPKFICQVLAWALVHRNNYTGRKGKRSTKLSRSDLVLIHLLIFISVLIL